jgi:hypothetical protein
MKYTEYIHIYMSAIWYPIYFFLCNIILSNHDINWFVPPLYEQSLTFSNYHENEPDDNSHLTLFRVQLRQRIETNTLNYCECHWV